MPSFVPRLLAYPMHGQRKLVAEGYRTRDGHLIEWFGRLTADHGGVGVVSRPDPALLPTRPVDTTRVAAGTRPVTPRSLRVPDLRDRRRWWVTSATAYPTLPSSVRGVPAVVWNPFVATAASARNPFDNGTVVMDLLDDWTKHFAFASIRAEVENAYREAFDRADHVTANAEGTVALARRFGRDDVVLLPNGCDPERFSTEQRAAGPMRVGYVGKIGHRLDLQGILRTVRALPDVEFVFAGPVLDREYRAPLDAAANVRLLGDVHYDDVPELLTTFDVGWVPHNVGAFEVGGDIIKTYEYRAAGLPTLSTPVDGAGRRGIDGVTALPIEDHASTLRRWTTGTGPRVPRMPTSIPRSATWQQKAGAILELVGA
ncbi:glycosyltransferase [Curtobacterium luteum]|nr:glycosyltransferase [Curtobacterium luteum]